ncbi:hypothetical protein EV361DRAFT_892721 [Lentinula raphanica]|uniref:Golgi to ER traffic protein 2 n=1 Tax=Lentinula raphanica TaxID=153919 RepID=A0AA38PC88_9AGAR|nr:hypothetical protein C8R42DRAFT_605300 [Lentinula raphanica]KAJ3770361.1 hypothetical protein FB446DRAFT_172323 [Lentinula raphanica]KAJ3829291.1 hypothetical protein F5880DRAFT_502271 [Lentinula raphanica]KAJ3840086.1 hypothetical protein F5878DRAFT_716752 [Lentinula raphanica]KAJ3974776.1 hypothetical protein EV361DRAFT_892721 [Lentinula raphanica]
MSAAARAEARRKAILSRGSDRLSKLATSARGDSPVYVHDDPPLPSISRTSNFVGDESPNIPTPPATNSRTSPGPSPRANRQTSAFSTHSDVPSPAGPDPSVWSDEQQQQLMQALLGSMGGMAGMPSLAGMGNVNSGQQAIGSGADPATMPTFPDNPFAAMLMGGQNGGAPPFMPPGTNLGKVPDMSKGGAQKKPPSLMQNMLPLVHLVALWSLLAYFVIYVEPQSQGAFTNVGESTSWSGILTRWAELAKRRPQAEMIQGWSVAVVPFFWAFITLEIALYSIRIFYGFDTVQPPMLLAMALPHLPPPLPSVIINGMKYLQLASILLDDLAILTVGVGFFICIAGFLRS